MSFSSGERTRLACWFRRLAETNFLLDDSEQEQKQEKDKGSLLDVGRQTAHC